MQRPKHLMLKIMYVEDNPANISLLQRIARMGGHEVINYTNGEVALSNFAKDDPDLVLMDLQLEGRISGLDVVKQLRARGFKTPIVAVTAYAMVGDRERCIEAGCNSYLSKPLPVAELVELVKDYESKSASKPSTPPETTAKAKPEAPKPETKSETVIESAPQTQPEAQAKPDADPEVKLETKSEAEPEAEPEPITEIVTTSKTETPNEPSADFKRDVNASLNGTSVSHNGAVN